MGSVWWEVVSEFGHIERQLERDVLYFSPSKVWDTAAGKGCRSTWYIDNSSETTLSYTSATRLEIRGVSWTGGVTPIQKCPIWTARHKIFRRSTPGSIKIPLHHFLTIYETFKIFIDTKANCCSSFAQGRLFIFCSFKTALVVCVCAVNFYSSVSL